MSADEQPRHKRRSVIGALFLALLSAPTAFVYVGLPRLALASIAVPLGILAAMGWSGLMFIRTGWIFTFVATGAALLAGVLWPPIAAWRAGAGYALKPYNRWWVYLLVLIVCGAVSQAIWTVGRGKALGFESYSIPSAAMRNTLQVGDYIVADSRRPQEFRRGSIVVYYDIYSGSNFVKRAVGLPGDLVEMRDCYAVINGQRLNEPYVLIDKEAENKHPTSCNMPAVRLGPDEVYMLGDNRTGSLDSRHRGPSKMEDVLSVPRMIWYSRDHSRMGMQLDGSS